MIPMARADSIQPRFIEMLIQKVGLTDSEVEAFLPFWQEKCLRKKDHFMRAGDICKVTAYVNKGCLRRYLLAENGKESILNFASEDWWVGDLESFHTQKPSPYYIQALEDSELLVLDRADYLRMGEICPKYLAFREAKVQRTFFATLQRLSISRVETPEEKYLKLAQSQPGLFQRVPLHYIASYLGLEPESLSRLRKRLSDKPGKS